jgi:hypothetical protein
MQSSLKPSSPANPPVNPVDGESEILLKQMTAQDGVKTHRVAGVRTVLVVLSSKGMVFDIHALRHEIHMAYPDATVFMRTTSGKTIGAQAPSYVDLLIDLTGPGQRQGLFYAKKLRRGARTAVGRNAGLFRKRIYDRIYDEDAHRPLPNVDVLTNERRVQREVLELAGVALAQTGETHPDLGKTIALGLPPMQHI